MNNGSQLVAAVRDLSLVTEWFSEQDRGERKLSRTTFNLVPDRDPINEHSSN